MYCIVSERGLRESEYGARGGFWRGEIINIKTSHDEKMPHIVVAIPSPILANTNMDRLVGYINRANSDRAKSYMLCKAMGTPNGVSYQILARHTAKALRDDGEFTQRRMVMIHPEKIDNDDYRNFNSQTKQVLSVRDLKKSRHFDALSMYWTNPQHLCNAYLLKRFAESVGSELTEDSSTDIHMILSHLDETYDYRSEICE